MDDSAQLLTLPATLEPISRPSSTSTQASLAQLPGIAALATGGSAANSPQLRATNLNPQPAPPPPTMVSGSSPSATVAGSAGSLPTCQNCTTSTTPLWRRDEMGSVLCNACGLFLKLHGRPRPISLKTDVIKSRNRVKTSMRPDMAMKKKQQQAVPVSTDVNGADLQSQANAAAAVLQARRTSQKSANGHVEGADSPVSRTATPNMYNPHLPGYPAMDDTQYQAQTLAGFAVAGASPGRATSPLNGERLDVPQTQEQQIAAISSLKTRVSELEVINDFMQRRLAVFEYGGAHEGQETGNQTDAQLRAQLEQSQQSEAQYKMQLEEAQLLGAATKAQLEDSHRRENMLKRRLDEVETELKESKEALEAYESGRAKKPRLTDMINDPDESAPRVEE